MTTHEFDAYLDMQPDGHFEPPYHEQIAVMQEMEAAHESNLKRQGAIEALHNLTITLSQIILRDNVQGDYLFGLYEAFQVVNAKLGMAKGGAV